MHCPSCNQENMSSAKFCKKCGTQMTQNRSRKKILQEETKWKVVLVALFVALVLVVIIVIFFKNKTKKTEQPANRVQEAASTQVVQEPATPVAAEPSAPVIIPKTQTHFYATRDFSDGKAWVKRAASSPWESIDENGKSLFTLGASDTPETDFKDNLAWVKGGSSQWKRINDKGDESFSFESTNAKITDLNGGFLIDEAGVKKIINEKGETVFPKDDGYAYKFGASYGKYQFVTRHINTFEKTEDQTGIIDTSGDWIIKPIGDLSVSSISDWISYGIIKVSYHDNDYYDANKNEFFKSEDGGLDSRIVQYAYKDDYLFLDNDGYYSVQILGRFSFVGDIKKGLFGLKDGQDASTGFYNKKHELVINLSPYKYIGLVGWISDGYFSVSLKNPQGNTFYTVINKKGEKMFEPITQPMNKVSCGRILMTPKEGSQYFMDVNGKTVISDIKGGSDFNENCLAKIQNGNDVYYIDIEGNIAF